MPHPPLLQRARIGATLALICLLTGLVAACGGSNQVTITFSGPVGAFSATNFTFINADTNSPAITVQSATQTGSNSVTLVLSSPLPAGSTNSLVVTGLTDPNGNAMTPAVVTVTAFTPQIPCAGGELLVKHAYSECNADGFWHVVEDDYYACPPNGAVTKFRVADDATTQPCGAGQNPPSPVGLIYPTAAQAGATCQSPTKLGEIQVCEVVGGLWSLSTYIKYQCADGAIYYSGPTQNVPMNPPTSGNQPPPPPAP